MRMSFEARDKKAGLTLGELIQIVTKLAEVGFKPDSVLSAENSIKGRLKKITAYDATEESQ
jgi:hypothetical protein